jgi:hypothetical protein
MPITTQDRTGKGLFKRSLTGAERDAECARMRAGGYLLREIAEHVGLKTEGAVAKAIDRALKDVQAPAVERLRAQQQTVIDTMKSAALDILAREHVAHSNGRVIYNEAGDGDLQPVLDDGPRIQAINALRQVIEREAKLWGTDSPIRTVVEGDELVIRIKGVDTDAV